PAAPAWSRRRPAPGRAHRRGRDRTRRQPGGSANRPASRSAAARVAVDHPALRCPALALAARDQQPAQAHPQYVDEGQGPAHGQGAHEQGRGHHEQPGVAQAPEPAQQRGDKEGIGHFIGLDRHVNGTLARSGVGTGSRRVQSRAAGSEHVQAANVGIPLRQIHSMAIPPTTGAFAPEEPDTKNNTLAIALASLLVGGVAVVAFPGTQDDTPRADLAPASGLVDSNGDSPLGFGDDPAIPAGGRRAAARVRSATTWWCRSACPSATATSAAPWPARSSVAWSATRSAAATAASWPRSPARWAADSPAARSIAAMSVARSSSASTASAARCRTARSPRAWSPTR